MGGGGGGSGEQASQKGRGWSGGIRQVGSGSGHPSVCQESESGRESGWVKCGERLGGASAAVSGSVVSQSVQKQLISFPPGAPSGVCTKRGNEGSGPCRAGEKLSSWRAGLPPSSLGRGLGRAAARPRRHGGLHRGGGLGRRPAGRNEGGGGHPGHRATVGGGRQGLRRRAARGARCTAQQAPTFGMQAMNHTASSEAQCS